MMKGNLVDYRTKMYPLKSYDEIVAEMRRSVWGRQLEDPRLTSYVKTLTDIEDSQADNVGPKSCFLDWPHDGPSKVEKIFSNKEVASTFNEDAWNQTLQDLSDLLLAGPKIHAFPLTVALKGMSGEPSTALDPTKNNGIPFFNKNWANFGSRQGPAREYAERAFNWVVETTNHWVDSCRHNSDYRRSTRDIWAMISQRTVQKGRNPFESAKVKRPVCAMPKYDVLIQKMSGMGLQQRISIKRNAHSGVLFLPAWRPAPVLDKSMQNFLAAAQREGLTVNSGDISNFDASIPPRIFWEVALQISKHMDDFCARLWLSSLYSDTFRCGCVSPNGIILPSVASSLKSGSWVTNMVGSLINFCINRYGHNAGYFKLLGWCGLGDDFITYGHGLNPQSVEAAFKDFNMEANATKQYFIPRTLHFLQKLHILGLPGGIGSVARVGGNVVVVEDESQLLFGKQGQPRYAFELQALARLENANFSPWFVELVEFFKASDKYHLGADWPVSKIVSAAGEYAQFIQNEKLNRPWTPAGMGVPFEHWSVNRVARGAVPPPLGDERFKFVYGRSVEEVDA
nr:MAG: putative RNA-dependent RNA polymerase [Picobirnavirus sp.]